VVNRVLRHNIRNDLNVVELHLRMLADERAGAGSGEHLDVALEHVDEMPNMAERARYVQETLGASAVEPVHLGSAIETAVDDTATIHPAAGINVDGPQDVSVLADTNPGLALREALVNGITH